MQYGIKLRTKHQSETSNNFENSYLELIFFFFEQIEFLTLSQLRLGYFVIKIVLVLNILPIFDSACFLSKSIDKNRIFSEIKIL